MSKLHLALQGIKEEPVTATFAQLQSYGTRLAAEDSASLDLVATFKAVVPAYLGYLTEQANSFGAMITKSMSSDEVKQNPISLEVLKGIQDDYLTKEPLFNYTYLSQTVVSVPESFNGKLPDYIEYMLQSLGTERGIYILTHDVLEEYQNMLSVFLSNKDAKMAMDVNRRLVDQALKFTKENQQEFHRFFPTNTGKSKARLGSLFDSLSEVKGSFTSISTLIGHYQKSDPTTIKAKVDRCVQLLALVVEQAGSGESIEAISPAMARKLSDGAMAIGQLVEFLSVHRYAHHTLITSMMNMYRDLNHTMKK